MNETNTTLPPTIYGYVRQVSARHQIPLVLLSITVFLLSVVPLEIQRRIINDAIQNRSVSAVVWLAVAYFGFALIEGGVKLCLNIYRSRVSELVVLDLRRRVAALPVEKKDRSAMAQGEGDGAEVSMMLSEVEPIGGFAGISVSEPLLQAGILVSVFGYLVYLEPLMALLCALAFAPQLVFVPLMQRKINRRSGRRIETLRSVGGNVGADESAGTDATAAQHERIEHVFELNLKIFRIKFTMYFLMNLTHHLGVATALGVGGYYVVQGQVDVGTVVAFVSGLGKVNDPWGDLVDWFREMTLVVTRYRLFAKAMESMSRRG